MRFLELSGELGATTVFAMASAPRPLGFWLRLLDQLIEDQFAATVEEHGLTRRQWQVLNVLREGPATLQELDDSVRPFLDAAPEGGKPEGEGIAESAVEQLDELIESGWVTRVEGSYRLTDSGSTAFERVREVVTSTRERVADGVSPEEYDRTLDVLERMARNLGWEA